MLIVELIVAIRIHMNISKSKNQHKVLLSPVGIAGLMLGLTDMIYLLLWGGMVIDYLSMIPLIVIALPSAIWKVSAITVSWASPNAYIRINKYL